MQVLTISPDNSILQPPERTDMLPNQLQWLIEKKKANMADQIELEARVQEEIRKILHRYGQLQAERAHCAAEVDSLRAEAVGREQKLRELAQAKDADALRVRAEISNCMAQCDGLNDQKNRLKAQLLTKEQNLNQNSRLINQLQCRIDELSSALADTSAKHQQQLQHLTQSNNSNITNIIAKYQQLIEEKVTAIESKYNLELEQIRASNRDMVMGLEEKYKQSVEKERGEARRNQFDSEHVLEENRRLLANVNDMKKKVMNLEFELEGSRQEQKIVGKEKEMHISNMRKENEYLKEIKTAMEEKIAKLNQVNDEQAWCLKQVQIEKQKELKRIKQVSDSMLDELSQRYRVEAEEFKTLLTTLRKENQTLMAKCQGLERERDSAKQIIEYMKKDRELGETQKNLGRSRNQIQNDKADEPSKYKSLNSELKKEMVRKNAEIEVLKQEVARLKSKCNKITVAFQQNIKNQEIVEKENKMLLSEIVFLREKNKSRVPNSIKRSALLAKQDRSNENSRILDMKSEESRDSGDNENLHEELEMYKQFIKEMGDNMNEALNKIKEKEVIIEKQKGIIERLERALKQ